MKKFTKTICLLVLLGISAQAQAIDFNWGLKGGFNLSGSSYKGSPPISNTTTIAVFSSVLWPK